MTQPAYRYLETVSGIVSEGYQADLYRHSPYNFIMAYQVNNNISIMMSILANHDARLYKLDRGAQGVVPADTDMFTHDGTFLDLFALLIDLKGYPWNEVMSGGKSMYDLYTRDTMTNWNVTGTLKADLIEDYSGGALTISSGNDTIIGESGGSDTLLVYADSTFDEVINADGGLIIGSTGSTLNTLRKGSFSLGKPSAVSGVATIPHGLGAEPSWAVVSIHYNATSAQPPHSYAIVGQLVSDDPDTTNLTVNWLIHSETLDSATYECYWYIDWIAGT